MARRGRPRAPLTLSDDDRLILTNWAAEPTGDAALATRARIILECARDKSNIDVAGTLGVSLPTVMKWRSRFLAHGLAGLADEPRSGAPRRITDEQIAAVIHATLNEHPPDGERWSRSAMATHLGISATTIGRIWESFALTPHLPTLITPSRDADFSARVQEVVGVYIDPPYRAMAFSLHPMGYTPRLAPAHVDNALHQLVQSMDDVALAPKPAEPNDDRIARFREFLAQVEAELAPGLTAYVIHDHPGLPVDNPSIDLQQLPRGIRWVSTLQPWLAELTDAVRRRGVRLVPPALAVELEQWQHAHPPLRWIRPAAGSSISTPHRPPSDAVTLALAHTFTTFDPHRAFAIGSIGINNNFLFESLYALDLQGRQSAQYLPQLAEGPLEQRGERTYRCRIRPDAKFHNGTPVTAADVVFSFHRLRAPALRSVFTPFVEIFETIRIVDARTVEFVFTCPTAVAESRIALPKIVPHTAVDSKGLGTHPIGSGPYQALRVSGDRVELEAFADYTGPRPATARRVTAQVVLNGEARSRALSQAKVAAIEEAPYPAMPMFQSTRGLFAAAAPGAGTSTISFHCGKPPFHDRRLRQAFLYAIDRQTITDSVYDGQAVPATSFLPDDHPYFRQPASVYRYDPDTARKLLADAGYPGGFETELLVSTEDFIVHQAPLIQQNLRDVGIRVHLRTGEAIANLATICRSQYTCYLAGADVSMFAWEPDLMFSIVYRGIVPRTMWFWDTPATARVARLLDQAERSASDEERRKLFGLVQDVLSVEVPQWPIHRRHQPTAWRDVLTGFTPLPTPGIDLAQPRQP